MPGIGGAAGGQPGSARTGQRAMVPDPEQLIGQALRAQVGGPRVPRGGRDSDAQGDVGQGLLGRFSSAQVLLMAAIVGLVLGMAAGFAVLVAR